MTALATHLQSANIRLIPAALNAPGTLWTIFVPIDWHVPATFCSRRPFGNRREQNTVRNPYDGNPDVTGQWIADYLYHRFYRIPEGVQVKLNPGAHKLGDSAQWFKTIPARADFFARRETVRTTSGVVVHYFYDAPLRDTSHNMSVSGAVATDLSICGIVYKDELYDVRKGR
jgi:hypothetical protein